MWGKVVVRMPLRSLNLGFPSDATLAECKCLVRVMDHKKQIEPDERGHR